MMATTTARIPETTRISVTLSTATSSSTCRIYSYLPKVEKVLISVMIAGISVTIKMLGKMKRTKGKISLIVVLAASSSACCLRWVRSESEKTLSDLEIGVPNRSV